MIVTEGEKVHVIMRRRFENDLRRHFIGEIKAVANTCVRLHGYAVIFDTSKNQFIIKPEERITVIDLAESGHFVSILPAAVKVEKLKYEINPLKRLVLTDGQGFSLDINEFGFNR